MSVQTILKMKGSKVVTVDAGTMAREAAQVMQHHDIGALIVTNGGRTAGVLTQRDLAYGLARHGPQLLTMRGKDLMQPSFISISPEQGATAVMSVMTRRRVTHIPVLDGDRLVGIVSIGDIIKDRLRDLELETGVLRDAYIAVH